VDDLSAGPNARCALTSADAISFIIFIYIIGLCSWGNKLFCEVKIQGDDYYVSKENLEKEIR
jgi:hypothetical protein